MWKPDDSLDEFIGTVAVEPPAEPPRAVVLQSTGEVEVLKPLARWETPGKTDALAFAKPVASASYRSPWLQRPLVIGGGLAVLGIVLASAILIGVSDSANDSVSSSMSIAEGSNDKTDRAAFKEEPLASDVFTPEVPFPEAENALRTSPTRDRSFVSRTRKANRAAAASSTRPVARFAAQPTQRKPAKPSLVISNFAPTTLVIFIENGQVKSRIEPWLAGLKRSSSTSN